MSPTATEPVGASRGLTEVEANGTAKCARMPYPKNELGHPGQIRTGDTHPLGALL